MALPIWGMYMRSCYEDEELKVSKDNFKKPKESTIEVDCENYKPQQDSNSNLPDEDTPEELDF